MKWWDEAACKGHAARYGYDLFYEERFEAEAKQMCAGCNVRLECLQDALQENIWSGIYGGLTPKERESHYRRWRYWTKRRQTPDFSKGSLVQWTKEMAG